MKITNKEIEIVSNNIENTIYECCKESLVLGSTNIEEIINEDLSVATNYSINVLNKDVNEFSEYLEEGKICKIKVIISLKYPVVTPEITKELIVRIRIISGNLDYVKESLNYEIYGSPIDSNIFNYDISKQQELILNRINGSISHLIETDSEFRKALDELIVNNHSFYLYDYKDISDKNNEIVKVNLANDTSKNEKFKISLYLKII